MSATSVADPLLVEQVRSMLENAGIQCHVPHRDLRSLVGAIPFSECWPEVQVVDDAQAPAAECLIEQMTASPQWAQACRQRDWTPITLLGDAFKTFLDAEITRIEGILKELGLA